MNTVTTKDIAETARKPRKAYDFFGFEWAGSTQGEEVGAEPVAAFGISDLALYRTSARDQKYWYKHPAVSTLPQLQGLEGMGAVRTSRRSRGFGGLEGILEEQIMGIPVWMLGAGAFIALGGLGMIGLGKKRR